MQIGRFDPVNAQYIFTIRATGLIAKEIPDLFISSETDSHRFPLSIKTSSGVDGHVLTG